MIQYRTGGFSAKGLITPVEVIRETTKQLIVLDEWNGKKFENRVAKMSEYHQYHYSWEEAHAYLIDQAVRQVENARICYESEKSKLDEIQKITKPLFE